MSRALSRPNSYAIRITPAPSVACAEGYFTHRGLIRLSAIVTAAYGSRWDPVLVDPGEPLVNYAPEMHPARFGRAGTLD